MPRRYRVALFVAVAALCAVCLLPIEGRAEGRLNVNLLAQRNDLTGSGSSCWGYIDPSTGTEYALMARSTGTGVYNLADPADPQLTGFIPGPESIWRNIKVYQTYAYVSTEGGGGVQIIDLSDPEAPFLTATYSGSGLSTIHTITCDTLNAKLYTNGANGGMRILDISNPTAPVQIGVYSASNPGTYVHDSHVRNDTLYAACINAGQIRILNVSNPASISEIVRFSSPGNAAHNCWTTEDRSYLLVTDETTNGRVSSWDISPITTPLQVDTFTDDPSGSVHNVQIKDNYAYIAHYTSGLQILDITDPTNLLVAGYYDTYPGGGLYDGAWGIYEALPSGAILISDIESGLFVFDFVEAPSYIIGTVTDAVSTLPIDFATVEAIEASITDDADGSGDYELLLEEGTYNVKASAFGYSPSTVMQATVEGDTVTLNFALNPPPSGSLSGTFAYSGGGAGIANANIIIKSTPLATTTDANGDYSFPQVPEGSYEVALDFFTNKPDSTNATISSAFANTVLNFAFDGVLNAYNFQDSSTAGWEVDVDGDDDASTGIWVRVNPRGTAAQPEDDHTPDVPAVLAKCWVTGQGPVGGGVGDNDVDGGKTTLFSPVFNLSGLDEGYIQYYRWFVNDAGSNAGVEPWVVQISDDGGTTWVTTDSTHISEHFWKEKVVKVSDFVSLTNQVRMRFIAKDDVGSIVEAGVDDFRIWGASLTTVGDTEGLGPNRFTLYPNSPNPFNPQTAIRFDLPSARDVKLVIYTPEGRRVKTLVSEAMPAGRHTVDWQGVDDSGSAVASGIYLMRLQAGPDVATRKMVLAK